MSEQSREALLAIHHAAARWRQALPKAAAVGHVANTTDAARGGGDDDAAVIAKVLAQEEGRRDRRTLSFD